MYGSFAFRGEGYAVLAQSPGCRPGWLAGLRAACQKLGERPAGSADAPGLFAVRLDEGPWAIVGVTPQGDDDRGRPGARAFHALFVSHRDYRRAGADPFLFAGALRGDWTEATRELPPLTVAVAVEPTGPEAPDGDPRADAIAGAIVRGRRVAVEAAAPVDELARQVWRRLPPRVRARKSVATWAFANGLAFDLIGSPRVAALGLDESYVVDPSAPPPELAPNRPLPVRPGTAAAVGLAVFLGGAAVALALRGEKDPDDGPPPAASSPAHVPVPPGIGSTPPRAQGQPPPDEPGEGRRVAEAVAAVGGRFGVEGMDPGNDPAELMERLAAGLRYRGPFLSDDERDRLAREPGGDPARALRWDAHARAFADDRPLPADFRRRPLRDQVRALAWSFHHETDAGPDPVEPGGPWRSPSEAVQALGEALAVDFPLRPVSPDLSARHPALVSYLGFLGRLPRR